MQDCSLIALYTATEKAENSRHCGTEKPKRLHLALVSRREVKPEDDRHPVTIHHGLPRLLQTGYVTQKAARHPVLLAFKHL
jgi:hypothetical protein